MKKNFMTALILSLSLAVTSIACPANTAAAGVTSNLRTKSSTSSYTGTTYSHDSRFDNMKIYNGIDVSYHQGSINWKKVKADGIDFAILRAGYRGYSQGSLATDTKFTTYAKDAIAAGIPLGIYFWTEAVNVDEAVQEAQYVVKTIETYRSSIKMPVVIDWELNANSRHAGLSKETNTAICTAFCDIIKQNGYTPMIYTGINELNKQMDGQKLSQKYEIWIARYNNTVNNSTLKFDGNYCMWQYSSKGSVDGISGNVDMNFWYTNSSPSSPTFNLGASTGSAASPEPAASPSPTKTPSPTEDPSDQDVDSLNNVKNLSAKSYAQKISLSWEDVEDADGYQIYRKNSYNGSYTKVKQLNDVDLTTWTNTGLSKNHEYYYKIRAYCKNSTETIYSGFTYITAATKTSGQVGITKKAGTLYKKPAKGSAVQIKFKKGIPVEYAGITYLKNNSKFYHYRYYTKSKIYDGYNKTKLSMTYYAQGNTTTVLNLRKTAGTSGKLITNIPKNTALPLLGTKKVKKAIWYKVAFSKGKNNVVTGYVAGSYIRK